MSDGPGKFFDGDYNSFCYEMLRNAEMDELPVAFQMDDLSDISLADIGDLCNRFETDTGLEMTGHLFTCRDCGKLHIVFEINYAEDDDDEPHYIQ